MTIITTRSVKDVFFWIVLTAILSMVQQSRETIHCPLSSEVAASLGSFRASDDLLSYHDLVQQQQQQRTKTKEKVDQRRKLPPGKGPSALRMPPPQQQGPLLHHRDKDQHNSSSNNHQHQENNGNAPTKKITKKKEESRKKPRFQIQNESDNDIMKENWSANPDQLEQWFRERLPPSKLPRPVQIMKEYIQQHSIWSSHGPIARKGHKYIVTSYECPHRAGNVLATFLNEMLLAVLTNRTAAFYIRGTKGDTSKEQECDSILQRAPWIPRILYGSELHTNIFNFYEHRIVIREAQQLLQVPRYPVGTFRSSIERELIARNKTAAILAQDLSDHDAIELRGLSGCLHSHVEGWEARFDWTIPPCRDYITALFQKESIDSDRANQLFELGIDFLYGMLFQLAFDFTPALLDSIMYSGVIDPQAFSIGVHSRHALESDDGSDISQERLCLDLVMKRRPSTSGCQLLVMSDRPATYGALQKYARAHNCEAIMVQHSTALPHGHYLANVTGYKNKGGVSAEHGPFEGAGFYKDMALVSQARHGLVCTMRSSSALIKQVIKYESVMRYYREHSNDDGSMEGYQPPETCFYEGNLFTKATIYGMDVKQ